MRVLVDAVSVGLGGGRTYVESLLAERVADPDIEVVVVARPDLELVAGPSVSNVIVVPRWLISRAMRPLWLAFGLSVYLRRLSPDVLYCPSALLPRTPNRSCRLAVMSQNLEPFQPEMRRAYPLGLHRARLWLLERALVSSFRRADLVVFLSENAQEVITRRAGTLAASVVIPHGVGEYFRADASTLPVRPEWLPDSEYLLYVSSFQPYKSHVEVVRAFAELKRRRKGNEKLVFVGFPAVPFITKNIETVITELGVANDVVVAGPRTHDELAAAYAHAKVGIFASTCESCPIILLEAMASGEAMVVSNRPPMPEFAGDAVMYADPTDPAALAAALEQLLDDGELRGRLGRAAAERAGQYRWSKAASETWSAIASLVTSASSTTA